MTQDDKREKELIGLFELQEPVPKTRGGLDAHLEWSDERIEIEIKSCTNEQCTVSTARDVGGDHIARWRKLHWLFGFYDLHQNLLYCLYGSPQRMKPWIDKLEEYVRPDVLLAQRAAAQLRMADLYAVLGKKTVYTLDDAKRLQKKQYSQNQYRDAMDLKDGYSPQRMLEILQARLQYIASRGSTLNNPHIPGSYFTGWPQIKADHAATLRRMVNDYFADKEDAAPRKPGEEVL